MCIVFVSFETHPELFALLAFNRDELLDRPTTRMQFWDAPHTALLAGKDLRAGGTWLGLTTSGRFACLTNFREVHYATNRPNRLSRGALVLDFLTQGCSPAQYVEGIDHERFDGYNVIVGDVATRSISYNTNRASRATIHLSPGLYGLSNGVLHQPGWAKVDKGVPRLQAMLDKAAAAARQPSDTQQHSSASATAHGVTDQPSPPPHSTNTHPPPVRTCTPPLPAPAARPQRDTACAPGSGALQQHANGECSSAGGPCVAAAAAQQDVEGRRSEPGTCDTAGDSAAGQGSSCGAASGEAQRSSAAGFEIPWEELFTELLGDAARVEDVGQLPRTGLDPRLEQRLSGVFVEPFPYSGSQFGTRSQTVVAIWKSGRVEARERSLDPERGSWQEATYVFDAATGDACS